MIRRRNYLNESNGQQRYHFTAVYIDFGEVPSKNRFGIYADADMRNIWQRALERAIRECPHDCCLSELHFDADEALYHLEDTYTDDF